MAGLNEIRGELMRKRTDRFRKIVAVLLSVAIFTASDAVTAEADVSASLSSDTAAVSEDAGIQSVQAVSKNSEYTEADELSEDMPPVRGYKEDKLYIPSIENNSEEKTGLSLPSKYDSRSTVVNGLTCMPPVEAQGYSGLCWAFSLSALASSSLLKQGLVDHQIDFSENQLSYFMYNRTTDPLGGTAGDCIKMPKNSTDTYRGAGGFNLDAVYAAATWQSFLETSDHTGDDNLKDSDDTNDNTAENLTSAYAYDNTYHLEDAYWVNIHDTADIKQLIYENGAASIGIHFDADNYMNVNNHAYYMPSYNQADHAVTIVGWDDDFSKDNFGTTANPETPSQNGAWLIRNSWGDISYWGHDHGYFWMSYEDKDVTGCEDNMYTKAYFLHMGRQDNYDNNYQYDGGSCDGYIQNNGNDYIEGADIYTAAASANGAEQLKAVAFASNSPLIDYSIQVYKNIKNASDPQSGTKALAEAQTGSERYAGFHTVSLNTPVSLNEGEKYSVVVRLKNSTASLQQVYFSTDISSYYSDDYAEYVSCVSKNQSFYRYDESSGWKDAAAGTDGVEACALRIKAYTDNVQKADHIEIPENSWTVSFDAGAGTVSAESMSVDNGKCISLPVPSRSRSSVSGCRYEFAGWFTKKCGEGIQITDTTPISSDMVLFAYWKTISVSSAIQLTENNVKFSTINKQTYSGQAVYPKFSIRYINAAGHSVLLTQGEDYTVRYRNNLNAGTAAATIYGIDNYSGNDGTTFIIDGRSIKNTDINISDAVDGSDPAVQIYDFSGTVRLVSGNDYIISTDAVRKTITITGKNNYKDRIIKKYRVIAAGTYGQMLSQDAVSLDDIEYTYCGNPVRPGVTVRDNAGNILVKGSDYTVRYRNNKNAGTASVTISGRGRKYGGTITKYFRIDPISIATGYTASFKKLNAEYVYTGKAICPAVKITYLDGKNRRKTLSARCYYTNYIYNIYADDDAAVILTGKGNYTGKLKLKFAISEKDISNGISVTVGQPVYDQNGNISGYPEITVRYRKKVLRAGVDYETPAAASFDLSERSKGRAAVTIRAVKGSDFTGTYTKYFRIKKG